MQFSFIYPHLLWLLLLAPLTAGLALLGGRRRAAGRFWAGLALRTAILVALVLALAHRLLWDARHRQDLDRLGLRPRGLERIHALAALAWGLVTLMAIDPRRRHLDADVLFFAVSDRVEPFGPMPALMAQAEEVDKLHAICVVCGAPASRTQRLIDGRPAAYDDPIILVGGSESYEARCRHCHEVPRKS